MGLLFVSSGIKDEIVVKATGLQVLLPRLSVPVAAAGHLIALKILAGRNQELADLGSLIPAAFAEDLDMARQAVRLIQARVQSKSKA